MNAIEVTRKQSAEAHKSPLGENEGVLERALKKAYARAVGRRLVGPEDFHGLLRNMVSVTREWIH